MTSELLGTDRRNAGQSWVATYSWLLSFAVMKTFLPLVNAWPVGLWLGYGAVSAAGLLFVALCVPETGNKSGDQIRASLMAEEDTYRPVGCSA